MIRSENTGSTPTWVKSLLISGVIVVGLFLFNVLPGLWPQRVLFLPPDASYCFSSERSIEQLLAQLDPVIRQGGYPYKLHQTYDVWYANEPPTAGPRVGDNFDVRIDVKTRTSRGEYRLILEQWPKVYGKQEAFTREGWRRWADLKLLVQRGTGLTLSVAKHPAVDTAPGDIERFSTELGIPVVANDEQCD